MRVFHFELRNYFVKWQKSVSQEVRWPIAAGEKHGEQSGVPDCVECLRYVQKNNPDIMFNIQCLHTLLTEKRYYVQS